MSERTPQIEIDETTAKVESFLVGLDGKAQEARTLLQELTQKVDQLVGLPSLLFVSESTLGSSRAKTVSEKALRLGEEYGQSGRTKIIVLMGDGTLGGTIARNIYRSEKISAHLRFDKHKTRLRIEGVHYSRNTEELDQAEILKWTPVAARKLMGLLKGQISKWSV